MNEQSLVSKIEELEIEFKRVFNDAWFLNMKLHNEQIQANQLKIQGGLQHV